MAVYKTVSSKEIIGRLLRRTRVTDSSFMDDLLEWFPEAMDKLKTRQQFESCYKTLKIENHSAKLPCGLVSLDAVAHKGNRLREGSSVANVKKMPSLNNRINKASIFVPDTDHTIENRLQDRISGTDLIEMKDDSTIGQYYKLQLDYIQTSFKRGKITIYYLKRPVDDEGYLLIPDNEDYKEALYWYGRMMMIEAGWEDPVFTWDKCYFQFYQVHAPRAITDISYPSVDTVERIRQATIRMIPPQHFYEDFFTGAEQYQGLNK